MGVRGTGLWTISSRSANDRIGDLNRFFHLVVQKKGDLHGVAGYNPLGAEKMVGKVVVEYRSDYHCDTVIFCIVFLSRIVKFRTVQTLVASQLYVSQDIAPLQPSALRCGGGKGDIKSKYKPSGQLPDFTQIRE